MFAVSLPTYLKTIVMKKLLSVSFLFFVGLTSVNAEIASTTNSDWTQVVCEITDEEIKHKDRTEIYVPQLYQSEEYLSVQTDADNYGNAQITVTNSQGETVKNDAVQVTAGGDNLYYIGDLESGTYEVKVEFDDIVMTGEISF